MMKESQEYWNELQLDGPVVITDSQTGDGELSGYPRLTRAASFSELFQLGVSQEIPRNPLTRQTSSIPHLYSGSSSGNLIKPPYIVKKEEQKEEKEEKKEKEEKVEKEQKKIVQKEEKKSENKEETTPEKAAKRKAEAIEQITRGHTIKKPRTDNIEIRKKEKNESIVDEIALGLTKVATLQQHLRLDSVDGILPIDIIENMEKIETLIQELIQEESNNREAVNQMFVTQTKAIKDNSVATFKEIIETEENFLAQVVSSLRRLEELLDSNMLNYHTLRTVRMLTLNLQIQSQQVTTLLEEIGQRAKTGNCNSCVKCWRLSIIEQPLPNVLFKGKFMESPTTVAICTGTQKLESLINCDVRCTSEAVQFQNTVQADPQKLNKLNRATFSRIKLTESTRMAVIYLKYESSIQESTGVTKLSSQASFPMVVISHESQWIDAASKLLLLECFSNSDQNLTWAKFTNILHYHFVSATRQDHANPKRPLQQYELQYFYTKYFSKKKSKDLISREQVENFFQWFGSASCLIRFKKHIYQFWTLGYIFRFTSKEKCEKILEDEPPGSFVIRFSESQKGLFGVTYVSPEPININKTSNRKSKNNNNNNNNNNNIVEDDDNTRYVIKHYLLKQDDTGPNKSLPDFLRATTNLKTIVICDALNGTVAKMDKDEAMKLYYTIRKTVNQKEGYVDDINS